MSVQEPILTDIRTLAPGAEVEFYVLDASNIPGGIVTRLHPGTNKLQQPVIWQGNTYTPWPMKITGFAMSGPGTLPRPQARVCNVGGTISALCLSLQDLVGASVIRKRTLVKYLDAANFGGYNPLANPNAQFEDDVFEIQRKVSETEEEVVFELSSALDIQGITLPGRQILANICPYIYRKWTGSAFDYTDVDQCPYTGTGYFDATGTATTAANDTCSRHVTTGCQPRYPGKQALPYGGYVGAGIVTQ